MLDPGNPDGYLWALEQALPVFGRQARQRAGPG